MMEEGFFVVAALTWAVCLVYDVLISVESKSGWRWFFRTFHSVIGGLVVSAVFVGLCMTWWPMHDLIPPLFSWIFFSCLLARMICRLDGRLAPKRRRLGNREILMWSCLVVMGFMLLPQILYLLRPDQIPWDEACWQAVSPIPLLTCALGLAHRTRLGRIESQLLGHYALCALVFFLISGLVEPDLRCIQMFMFICYLAGWLAFGLIRSRQHRSGHFLVWD